MRAAGAPGICYASARPAGAFRTPGSGRRHLRASKGAKAGLTNRKNPFIAAACKCGDNHLQARNIRNSISLTVSSLRRIICASN